MGLEQVWGAAVHATADRLLLVGDAIGENSHLRPFLREELRARAGGWEVDRTEITLKLPNWLPRPKGLDACMRRNGVLSVGELKVEKTDEVLWDLLKMADAVSMEHVESAYLVVGVPVNLTGPDHCSELFAAEGVVEHDVQALFEANAEAWYWLLHEGSARPTRIPSSIQTERLCSHPIQMKGGDGSLCLVSVKPMGPPTVEFATQYWCGEWPMGVDPTDSYVDWKRRTRAFLRAVVAKGPLAERDAEALAKQHRLKLAKPYGLRYGGEMMISRGPDRSVTAAGERFLEEWGAGSDLG